MIFQSDLLVLHQHKHSKLENLTKSKSTQNKESKSLSPKSRDGPNNPFSVKEDESVCQASPFHNEKSRKLAYVFRGKKIQYHPGEDLHNTGDSPFTLSTPKLLVPNDDIPS
ncbi:uncharacterized protein MELLADRAFT_112871 [Melampsora larici-populina 98AG31]|uniref:Uncharacterized protein n=1 Tax=Melampsora larici-populina (strain 98AG31 / pathotype 3-4-7) TaxID=747676 RepID=F4S7Z0_MELLP|nr:uncharacterized protein MELLADRAFT_112871 [Melampsora larici-populina 98AG31]EGF99192.1 hypothetical protein MELLADRAFT_112871 [Melampsora larici-populina 98AG31]